ncbi:hypothetical protein [Pseudobacter ginsenosidimutans]|uniref:Uncharacterized protein n=1 Tax=Pseudobacter ginsenosidimutans TaxID=661488 RepID=A0A4Q7N302_9BACT|nr:hypothetical protein [Pseudobacter ginsenosidimutans]QEC43292.1 hypothetical protein FSB84_16900 [Pseudobacter ginsenosidimutans]RZS74655.1 hypothetical protein EV199_0504 [Pseudobacter ginsenosidimutans]
MKTLIIIIWLVIVALGIVFGFDYSELPKTTTTWTAAKQLEQYHQINEEDLLDTVIEPHLIPYERNLLTGRHLIKRKNAGDPVTPADVSALPVADNCRKDSMTVYFPLSANETYYLKAIRDGSWIKVCGNIQSDKTKVPICTNSLYVLAVHQKVDTTVTAFLMLRVAAIDGAALSQVVHLEDRTLFMY